MLHSSTLLQHVNTQPHFPQCPAFCLPVLPSLPPPTAPHTTPHTEGLVTTKGRVAAELNVGHDELVLTELLLGGAFADTTPDTLAALCSCFCWSERSRTPPA